MLQQLYRIAKRLLNIQLTIMLYPENMPIRSQVHAAAVDIVQRARSLSLYILLAISLWVAMPSLGFAKDVSSNIPENASVKSYGDGWNCNPGYRESEGACAAVKVPVNAYPTNKTYGKGWLCKRGFRETEHSCNPIIVPEFGYLDYSGLRVKCDRGYIMVKDVCLAVKVPANGYLKESSYGPGWTCDRGFRENNGACVALSIPENAHIGFSGKVWECNKPYVKRRDSCLPSEEN